LVFKTTKKLTGQTQVKAPQKGFLYSKKSIAYHLLSFNEMFASIAQNDPSRRGVSFVPKHEIQKTHQAINVNLQRK